MNLKWGHVKASEIISENDQDKNCFKYDQIILEIVVGLYINVTSPYNNYRSLENDLGKKTNQNIVKENRKQKIKEREGIVPGLTCAAHQPAQHCS